MRLWILATLVPVCGAAVWLCVRTFLLRLAESQVAFHAREQFRRRREHLEADFLRALELRAPMESLRWEDARWEDDVVWARDRRSRRLIALVSVSFEAEHDQPEQHATAVFTYRSGRWHAEGEVLDAFDAAVAARHRFELLTLELPAPSSRPDNSPPPRSARGSADRP